jgi:heptosyltransferase-2
MTPTPVKLTVVTANWLGDAIMALPLLGELAAARHLTLSVLSRPYAARVFRGIAGVDEWVVCGGGRLARIHRQARALRALGVGATVTLPPSFSSALPAWLAGVEVRVGYGGDGRDRLLTDALPMPPRGSEHLSQSYLRLGRRALAHLGRATPADAGAARLDVGERDRREAARLLDALGMGPARDYAVVVPGAAYGPAKSWPPERFREAARELARELPVILLGGPGERRLCREIADAGGGVFDGAGRTSLGGFFALVEGARVLVANDSGAPHVAGALGVPTVVLFGSTSPQWTRPLGESVTVIRHPVHCAPCFRKTCPTQLECFAGIGVGEVVAAARRAAAMVPASKKGVAHSHTAR